MEIFLKPSCVGWLVKGDYSKVKKNAYTSRQVRKARPCSYLNLVEIIKNIRKKY